MKGKNQVNLEGLSHWLRYGCRFLLLSVESFRIILHSFLISSSLLIHGNSSFNSIYPSFTSKFPHNFVLIFSKVLHCCYKGITHKNECVVIATSNGVYIRNNRAFGFILYYSFCPQMDFMRPRCFRTKDYLTILRTTKIHMRRP